MSGLPLCANFFRLSRQRPRDFLPEQFKNAGQRMLSCQANHWRSQVSQQHLVPVLGFQICPINMYQCFRLAQTRKTRLNRLVNRRVIFLVRLYFCPFASPLSQLQRLEVLGGKKAVRKEDVVGSSVQQLQPVARKLTF